MKIVKQDCFAVEIPEDALKEKVECKVFGKPDCEKCSFYKKKSEIKNNIFYKYSYDNEEDYYKDLAEYKKKYNISNLDDFED